MIKKVQERLVIAEQEVQNAKKAVRVSGGTTKKRKLQWKKISKKRPIYKIAA